jgi:carbonic anhydrase
MTTLTKEMRDSLSPEQAIELLKDGNQRFVSNLKMNRNLLSQINETSENQYPFALVLSCIDSRTSAELIFDQGLGDIFSCRIAGNILNSDIVGSMEFSTKVAGVKLIMVLGHTECGAIKGACDNLKVGKLTSLLRKIKPAIKAEKTTLENRNSGNYDFVTKVASLNVKSVIKKISKSSSIIKKMHQKKEIAIIGGMYDVGSGVVEFF